ncbi:MAG: Transcription antitermination protein NusB [Chlamydiales bacterium]|nr:Transcription antitermination protein NusB [Chlamydiales bacterium]MCH9634962.1 Transcription antitermination protein NusB [Chlamydiales bacterium]MCH9704421.1 hypothetical protein [Chlamydiota bacterium]
MTMPQKSREFVLQDLYSLSLGGEASLSIERSNEIFAVVDQLDEKIAATSKDYTLDRIDLLDRNILRLSLFEFLENRLEPKIIISEALRLSRKFSTKEASRFIHALLDALIALPARDK